MDTLETAGTLIAFAVGLPFLGGVRILVPAFYAFKDAKKPVVMATVAVVANLIFASLLGIRFRHEGLALALSLAAFVNFCGLMFCLKKHIASWSWLQTFRLLLQSGVASLVMGGGLVFILGRNWFFQKMSLWWHALELMLLVIVGMLIFFIVARLVGCREIQSALALFQRRSHSSKVKS